MAIEALLEGEAEGLTRKAVEMALGGDTTALRLCLERLVPPRKDKLIAITLPKLMAVGDLPSVTSAVLEAVANGDMTPSEGEAVSRLVEAHRRGRDGPAGAATGRAGGEGTERVTSCRTNGRSRSTVIGMSLGADCTDMRCNAVSTHLAQTDGQVDGGIETKQKKAYFGS